MTIDKNILERLKQNFDKFCGFIHACKQTKDNKSGFLSTEIQHTIINKIMDSLRAQVVPFGTIVRNEVLSPYGYAIYVDSTNSKIVLLKNINPELCKCEEVTMVRFLFDILALTQSLEKNLFVYRVSFIEKCDSVLYHAAEECTPVGDKFKLNASQALSFEGGHWYIKENNIFIYKECFLFEEVVYNQFKALFESIIFPTEGLGSYISYNYQTKEDYINQKSLKRAKTANWIAILVGVSSLVIGPCINLRLNNKYGQVTLSNSSIDSLVNAKQTIQVVRDTIIIPKQDTVKCIIIQDKTKQTKGGKK